MNKQEKCPFVGDVVYRPSLCFIYRQRHIHIQGSDVGRFVWDTVGEHYQQVSMIRQQIHALDSAINLLEPA